MDGVPGISQPPIKPGEVFTYEFTPPDAGSFWYHPHVDSLQQIGRGLSGALVVEEQGTAHGRSRPGVDALRLASERRRSDPGGFRQYDGGHDGRPDRQRRNAERQGLGWRSRCGPASGSGCGLVNGGLARIMALRFDGHRPLVVAIDGQPCDPHEPEAGRLLLGPAMRMDVLLDMEGEAGGRYQVVDDFYDGLAYPLTELAYDMAPPLRAHPLDAPRVLPRNPLPEPDLSTAERHELVLQGGMMGGGMMAGLGGMSSGQGGMMGGGMMGNGGMNMGGMGAPAWAINGSSMTGDGQAGMTPLLTLKRGQSYLLTLRNQTAWWHPIHLHGHSFRVLSRNGAAVPHHLWGDTVLISPREAVEIAFVADNPGDWMIHCHVMDHQVSGLMGILRIA